MVPSASTEDSTEGSGPLGGRHPLPHLPSLETGHNLAVHPIQPRIIGSSFLAKFKQKKRKLNTY